MNALGQLVWSPSASPRMRKYAHEAAGRALAKSNAKGMGDQNTATNTQKNQISRWADAAAAGDQASYVAAVNALSIAAPWGDSGPNWYTSVSNGGWYAYPDVTTMISTTIAERHPEWLTAVGTTVGTAADVTFGGGAIGADLGSPTAVDVTGVSQSIVNTGGGALQTGANDLSTGTINAAKAACAAIPGATWNDSTQSCTLPTASMLKTYALLAGLGIIALGVGYGVITNYARGRGLRANRPRRVARSRRVVRPNRHASHRRAA